MSDLHSRKSIPPFMYISREKQKLLRNGREFKIIIYGAYNACGLIGTECNGIAILDEGESAVLVDEIERAPSGYDTPNLQQLEMIDEIMSFNDKEFIDFVNSQPRARYYLEG